MKTFLKITGIALAVFLTAVSGLIISYFAVTEDVRLDPGKLIKAEPGITVYDSAGNEIVASSLSGNKKSATLKELPDYTVKAFIASEDRNFYSHNGLNLKRMAKAAYKNLISKSFKEGASTISQQLIKNTHLSNEKTISRKLKEIRLTGKLERQYTKNQILEMYLNTIYFGHNCYGIESAAKFYFNKRAKDLTLEESAVLAGLLSSPNNYSPFKNPEKSLKRRNIVLKSMKDCNFLDGTLYAEAIKSPLTTQKGENYDANDYITAVFDELEETGVDFYSVYDGCKIYTNLRTDIQNLIEKPEYPCDNAVIVTDNNGKVLAYKSTVNSALRQPGSAIKPLAVYAPAIEEKIISPCTKICDEGINYGGYSPENADKKFHGYVSAAEALKMSYNVPTVKILNTLKTDVAENYLRKMNINLSEEDKNLALALGGMSKGVTIKQLADGYSAFANYGVFTPSNFINKIVLNDNNTIYKAETYKEHVFCEGTAGLINDMLVETSKSGTAKKLKSLPFEVAAKTGTCGDESGNTDAYALCYTTQNCVGIWLGDKNNKRLAVTGGKDCCRLASDILSKLYASTPPAPFDNTTGTQEIEIDADEYNNYNKMVLADKNAPPICRLKVKVLKNNLPKITSQKFTCPNIAAPQITIKQNAVNIELCHTQYYEYSVFRTKNGQKTLIYDGKWKKTITDLPDEGVYTYTVIPRYSNQNSTFYGEEYTFPPIKISNDNNSPQVKIPNLIDEDWYNY